MSDNLDAVETRDLSLPEGEAGGPPTETADDPADTQAQLSQTAEEAATEGQPEVAEAISPDAPEVAAPAREPDQPSGQEDVANTAEPSTDSAPKHGMTEMFSDDYTYKQPKTGQIREAQIISIGDDGIMVGLGLKQEGLIPAYDLQRVGQEIANALSIGDEIPVYIVRPEDRDGNIIVSWYRARQEHDWFDAKHLLESNEIWEGEVTGYNRGGLIVPFGKIRGFVPASHVTGISRRMDNASLQARLSEMVGQTLPLRILEVNREGRRLILSERIARREWRAKKREQLLTDLREGDIVHGVVSNICDFGVFLDIGGTDGLVHISELSWRRTNHPREVVKPGEELDAYVLRVDREHRRIGLSLKMLEEDPWESAEVNYSVGQLVTGVVTKLTDFGAFAALEDGIEGLIHISELADVPPRHPSEAIARGAELPLLVVKVDGRRRRMGLSLKRVTEEDWYQWEEERREQAAEAAAAEAALADEAEALPPAEAAELMLADEADTEAVPAAEVSEPTPTDEAETEPLPAAESLEPTPTDDLDAELLPAAKSLEPTPTDEAETEVLPADEPSEPILADEADTDAPPAVSAAEPDGAMVITGEAADEEAAAASPEETQEPTLVAETVEAEVTADDESAQDQIGFPTEVDEPELSSAPTEEPTDSPATAESGEPALEAEDTESDTQEDADDETPAEEPTDLPAETTNEVQSIASGEEDEDRS